MSMSELAGALGVEQRWVEELEAGRLDPPFDVLRAVIKKLGVRSMEFMALVEELETVVCSEEGRVRS